MAFCLGWLTLFADDIPLELECFVTSIYIDSIVGLIQRDDVYQDFCQVVWVKLSAGVSLWF